MKVSIIIPTFNVEKYISDALKSCLNQTYQDIEIICIDNNSTDRTIDIIISYQKEYPSKIQLLFEKLQGAAYARNKGLKNCSGQWVQFLDADDILKPQKIELNISILNNINIDFIVGSWEHQKLDGSITKNPATNGDLIKAIFLGKNCGNTCANLWKKESLLSVGGFSNIPDCHDPDLMLKLILKNKIYVSDERYQTLVRLRPEGGQISSTNLIDHYLRHCQLRIDTLNNLKNNFNKYYLENSQFLITVTLFYIRKVYLLNQLKSINFYEKNFNFPNKLIYNKEIPLSKTYVFLYNVLGFRKVEFLIQLKKDIQKFI